MNRSKLYVETTSYGHASYYDNGQFIGLVMPLRYWGREHYQLSSAEGTVRESYPTFAAADRAMHVYAQSIGV